MYSQALRIQTAIHKIDKQRDLLYGTGKSFQYLVITYNGTQSGKKYTYKTIQQMGIQRNIKTNIKWIKRLMKKKKKTGVGSVLGGFTRCERS